MAFHALKQQSINLVKPLTHFILTSKVRTCLWQVEHGRFNLFILVSLPIYLASYQWYRFGIGTLKFTEQIKRMNLPQILY